METQAHIHLPREHRYPSKVPDFAWNSSIASSHPSHPILRDGAQTPIMISSNQTSREAGQIRQVMI